MDALRAIVSCFSLTNTPENRQSHNPEERKAGACQLEKIESAANQIVILLCLAEKDSIDLQYKILDIARHSGGWNILLAQRVFEGVQKALFNLRSLSPVIMDAYARSFEVALNIREVVKQHQYYPEAIMSLVALGVCALLIPWVIWALGFSELGPVEGSFAAWWQSAYAGCVPNDSLVTFFQKLGMVWKV